MRRVAVLAVVLPLLSGLPATANEFSTVDWHRGADGFALAIEEAQSHQKPMLVYFQTDWCGYCRQFERELLSTEEVQIFTDKIVRVLINPESGAKESQIASAYGVRGYPAIYMHPAPFGRARLIQRTAFEEGQVRLQTPVEFVQTLSRAAHD